MTEEQARRWDKVRRVWEIIERLRGEGGCPWDRKQTPESVQTYLIEEAHEAAAAVRSGQTGEAGEELGDLLFMVFFMVYLFEEQGSFRLEDVCDWISEKMVRRHPHVFGDTVVRTADEVRDNWEKIKAGEKASAGKERSEVPESLPALMRAYRILSRRARNESGLDDAGAVVREFESMSRRLVKDFSGGDRVSAEVFGELLLTLVNLARLEKHRAEDCLRDRLRSLEPEPAGS